MRFNIMMKYINIQYITIVCFTTNSSCYTTLFAHCNDYIVTRLEGESESIRFDSIISNRNGEKDVGDRSSSISSNESIRFGTNGKHE